VTRVKAGDKVAVNPSHACGQCDYCRGGRFNLCRNMRFLGSASVYPHVQGMFRERFVMGEAQLTPISEDISLGEIACAEPLSIGLHAVHRAGGELLGKTVLVTGGGTIGCMCVLAARLAGAAESDRVRHRRPRAHDCAAGRRRPRHAFRPGRRRRSWPTSPTSASRPPAARPRWPPACRPRAAAAASSRWAPCRPTACMFPANSVMQRELDYVGVFRAAHAFDWAVQALRTRRVDVRPLISAQIPIADAAQAPSNWRPTAAAAPRFNSWPAEAPADFHNPQETRHEAHDPQDPDGRRRRGR
jgi:L-idonate 5-dehydrogenase